MSWKIDNIKKNGSIVYNTPEGHGIFVMYNPMIKNGKKTNWTVTLNSYPFTQKQIETKSAALSFAKRWMRAHPNG